jgi:UDP-N-acetylmuramoylalanine--D-glutamate ligase
VVGLGISGRSACELLLRRGVEVIGTDLKPRDQFGSVLEILEKKGCSLRLGEHRLEDFLGVDEIIVSPGAPLELEPLQEAVKSGIPVTGELDWAWQQVDLPVVAITGTNGKTTTTSLLGEMFKTAGRKVFVGGNIGTPLSVYLLNGARDDLLVLEVSSFQLDSAHRFRPNVGVLLNVTEDHLDRYESFDAYEDSKFSLFSRQHANDVAILNGDDPLCMKRRFDLPVRPLLFSRKDEAADATVRGGRVVVRIPDREPFTLDITHCPLKGVHNEENIMAAALAAASMGVSPSAMQETLDRYCGLSHRVERVRSWKGIDFYDDSKATNVGAVVKAIETFDRPILLFLGGRDKMGSYDPLVEPLNGKCKGVLAFGEAAPRIEKELGKRLPVASHPDLETAFQDAVANAASGDIVLLSPACSSFDQYESYAKRGDHFKKLVAQLPE